MEWTNPAWLMLGPLLMGPATPRGLCKQAPGSGAGSACGEEVFRALSNPRPAFVKGMVLVHLDEMDPDSARIAALSYDPRDTHTWLRIFRCTDQGAQTDFALQQPDGEEWDELETFPSNGEVPGVVVWGSWDYSRTQLIVVCYTGSYTYLRSGERVEKPGIFKVAFKGDDATLVHLNLDGIPEVVAHYDAPIAEVWTYIDGTYVKVGRFARERLWSDEVRQAIEALKRKTPAGKAEHRDKR